MCHPAAMAVLMVAQSAMTIRQQDKIADANTAAASEAVASDYQRLLDEQTAVNDKAAQEKLHRQIQTAKEQGRIRAIQGEAGVEGVSTVSILNNALMAESMDLSTIETNRKSGTRQVQAGMESVRARAQSRINDAYSTKVGGIGAAMNLATAGVSGYNMGANMKSSLKKMGSAK